MLSAYEKPAVAVTWHGRKDIEPCHEQSDSGNVNIGRRLKEGDGSARLWGSADTPGRAAFCCCMPTCRSSAMLALWWMDIEHACWRQVSGMRQRAAVRLPQARWRGTLSVRATISDGRACQR